MPRQQGAREQCRHGRGGRGHGVSEALAGHSYQLGEDGTKRMLLWASGFGPDVVSWIIADRNSTLNARTGVVKSTFSIGLGAAPRAWRFGSRTCLRYRCVQSRHRALVLLASG